MSQDNNDLQHKVNATKSNHCQMLDTLNAQVANYSFKLSSNIIELKKIKNQYDETERVNNNIQDQLTDAQELVCKLENENKEFLRNLEAVQLESKRIGSENQSKIELLNAELENRSKKLESMLIKNSTNASSLKVQLADAQQLVGRLESDKKELARNLKAVQLEAHTTESEYQSKVNLLEGQLKRSSDKLLTNSTEFDNLISKYNEIEHVNNNIRDQLTDVQQLAGRLESDKKE